MKQRKQKLKLRGINPFVINQITPSGIVHLETLDGEPMANFINGSQLCVYHEPLIDSMLARMHTAGNCKEVQDQMKQEALAEGQARATLHCQQRLRINKIQALYPLPSSPPALTLKIGVETPTNSHTAFLDLGTGTNVLPLTVYSCLKNKAAILINEVLYSFQDVLVTIQGVATALLHINGRKIPTFFQLINCGNDEQVVLGKPWSYEHKCIINYATLRINFIIDANHFYSSMVPSIPESSSPSLSTLATLSPIILPKQVATKSKTQ